MNSLSENAYSDANITNASTGDSVGESLNAPSAEEAKRLRSLRIMARAQARRNEEAKRRRVLRTMARKREQEQERRQQQLKKASETEESQTNAPEGIGEEPVFQSPSEPDSGLEVIRKKARKRRRHLILSALFFIGGPTALAIAYFGFIASDQYVARANFAIRSPSSPTGTGLSLLGGAVGNASDISIVQKYVASRQLLEDIKPYLNLRKIYSNPKADWWARLNPDVPEERMLDYWQSMVVVNFDIASGLAELDVHAFTPKDSKEIADRVLLLSEDLVNRLSERARADALALSKKEVEKAYAHLNEILDMLQYLPKSGQGFDPEGLQRARQERQASLTKDIEEYHTRIDELSKTTSPNSPSVTHLNDQVKLLESQLTEEKATLPSAQESTAKMLQTYDKLSLERGFAEQAYTSALSALEAAQVEAMRQDRYLEAFVRPQLPEYPELPRRIRAIVLVVLGATLVWAIGSLLVAATKEHL